MSHAKHEHSIEIDAPIQAVWNLMVGFSDYARWNPFVIRADAPLHVGCGSPLRLTAHMPAGWKTRTRHRVTAFSAPNGHDATLEYEVVGLLTWLVGGIRTQTLHALGPTTTRYTSVEQLFGPLARLAPVRQVAQGVMRHAAGLKRAAEAE